MTASLEIAATNGARGTSQTASRVPQPCQSQQLCTRKREKRHTTNKNAKNPKRTANSCRNAKTHAKDAKSKKINRPPQNRPSCASWSDKNNVDETGRSLTLQRVQKHNETSELAARVQVNSKTSASNKTKKNRQRSLVAREQRRLTSRKARTALTHPTPPATTKHKRSLTLQKEQKRNENLKFATRVLAKNTISTLNKTTKTAPSTHLAAPPATTKHKRSLTLEKEQKRSEILKFAKGKTPASNKTRKNQQRSLAPAARKRRLTSCQAGTALTHSATPPEAAKRERRISLKQMMTNFSASLRY